jgi:hypothetical protein
VPKAFVRSELKKSMLLVFVRKNAGIEIELISIYLPSLRGIVPTHSCGLGQQSCTIKRVLATVNHKKNKWNLIQK